MSGTGRNNSEVVFSRRCPGCRRARIISGETLVPHHHPSPAVRRGRGAVFSVLVVIAATAWVMCGVFFWGGRDFSPGWRGYIIIFLIIAVLVSHFAHGLYRDWYRFPNARRRRE